ncbi:hypothetical protein PVAP13_6KG338412 [Panicum virgatum]|uniref:Uncharacterized protein n=1 Tax=Panicum virgatum TaxID=38727 RepID=A0A8T0RHZ2_PANVG|nr:hypothetical protein PVAP13_6KG338412 [Panicum virgatum]
MIAKNLSILGHACEEHHTRAHAFDCNPPDRSKDGWAEADVTSGVLGEREEAVVVGVCAVCPRGLRGWMCVYIDAVDWAEAKADGRALCTACSLYQLDRRKIG